MGIVERTLVTLEWAASPINDMFADSVLSAILKCETLSGSKSISRLTTVNQLRFKGDQFFVQFDGKKANIDLSALEVTCDEDANFKQIVHTAVLKLYQSLAPSQVKL